MSNTTREVDQMAVKAPIFLSPKINAFLGMKQLIAGSRLLHYSTTFYTVQCNGFEFHRLNC